MLTRNLQYANTEGTLIDMEIEHPVYGWIPFTASPNDPEEHGRVLYSEAKEGKLGQIAPYVEPEPLPEPIPQAITLRQARLYLYHNDLLDQVEAMIAGNKAYEIEWEYATTIERNNPLTQAIIAELGLTEAQANTMFIEASKL